MDNLGQLGLVRTVGFSSWLIRLVTRSHWNHTVCRVSEHNIVSAETTGVAILPADHFKTTVWSQFPLGDKERARIIAFSLAQVGKPYGRLTFVWIGVSRITRWVTPRWLERRISDQNTWICSQLCDAAYQAAGIHMFRDNRPPGAVTPSDIAGVMRDFGWVDRQ